MGSGSSPCSPRLSVVCSSAKGCPLNFLKSLAEPPAMALALIHPAPASSASPGFVVVAEQALTPLSHTVPVPAAMLQRVVPGAVVDLPPLWHYMAGLRTPCEHLVRSVEIYPAYVADVVKGLLGWRVPHYSDIRGHSLADWAEWKPQDKQRFPNVRRAAELKDVTANAHPQAVLDHIKRYLSGHAFRTLQRQGVY